MKATLIPKKTYIDTPVEEGKVYTTKFQTGDKFKIEKIIRKVINGTDKIIRIDGYYIGREHLGICPLPLERLLVEPIETGTIMVCSECGAEHETKIDNTSLQV